MSITITTSSSGNTRDDVVDPSSILTQTFLSPEPVPQNQPHHIPINIPSIRSTLQIRQIPSQGIPFKVWPAATSLVSLFHTHTISSLLSKPSKSRRFNILELGSGTGLLGIAAAAILGGHVTLTDVPSALENLTHNARVNEGVLGSRGGSVKVAKLRWGHEDDHLALCEGKYDLVLGSDLVYEEGLYEPLVKSMEMVGAESEGVVFIMSHLKRWKKESAFFKKASKVFDVKRIHVFEPLDGCRLGVAVYTFTLKKR